MTLEEDSIPAAMQSAFMFRKEYVHQYLLPAIALHRQPDLQLERARRQLVEKLSDENKIPAMLYMQFAEKFCESPSQANGTQDSMSMKDKMSDLDLMLAGIPRLAIRFVEKRVGTGTEKNREGASGQNRSAKELKIPKDEWKNSLNALARTLREHIAAFPCEEDLPDVNGDAQVRPTRVSSIARAVSLVLDTIGRAFILHMNRKIPFNHMRLWLRDILAMLEAFSKEAKESVENLNATEDLCSHVEASLLEAARSIVMRDKRGGQTSSNIEFPKISTRQRYFSWEF